LLDSLLQEDDDLLNNYYSAAELALHSEYFLGLYCVLDTAAKF